MEKYKVNIWMYRYSQIQVQKKWRTKGQICPVLSLRFWTFSPGLENTHTLKCLSGIFPTILIYMIMLENCQDNISLYGCSPIKGTKLYSCWNSMKPGSQSGTYKKKILQNIFCILHIFYCLFKTGLLQQKNVFGTEY